MRIGSYQCPICHIRSGIGWSGEPGEPPICCNGVRMVAYELIPPNNSLLPAAQQKVKDLRKGIGDKWPHPKERNDE